MATFKFYKDLCDVVSVLVYCAAEKSYLLNKDASGEYWLPSSKADKKSWKLSAQKLQCEVSKVTLKYLSRYPVGGSGWGLPYLPN